MSEDHPKNIEDLKEEVQMPVLVREHYRLAEAIRKLADSQARMQAEITALNLWRAQVKGALALAGALGGLVGTIGGAIASAIIGGLS